MFDRVADFIVYFLIPLAIDIHRWFISGRGSALCMVFISIVALIGGQEDSATTIGLAALTFAVLSLKSK